MTLGTKWLAPITAAAFAIGCAETSAPSLTLDGYLDEAQDMYCQTAEACYGVDLLRLYLGDSCQGSLGKVFEDANRPLLEAAVAANRVTFDGTEAGQLHP